MNISHAKHTGSEMTGGGSGRYVGLDILKVLAIVFIPSVHFCSYFFQNEDNNMMFVIMHAFRWLFFSGTGLFMTISGYLNGNKRLSGKHILSIVKLYLIYLVYCILDAFILHDNTSIETVKYYALSYPAYYWYVSFWILMMFFLPFINKAVENCTLKEYLFLVGSLFVFISLPCVFSQLEFNYNLPDIGVNYNFPILYYVIGAGFRKFSFRINKYVSLASLIIIILLQGSLDFLYCKRYNAIGSHLYICNNYSNPFTVIVIVLIFLLLYDIKDIRGGYTCLHIKDVISNVFRADYCRLCSSTFKELC